MRYDLSVTVGQTAGVGQGRFRRIVIRHSDDDLQMLKIWNEDDIRYDFSVEICTEDDIIFNFSVQKSG